MFDLSEDQSALLIFSGITIFLIIIVGVFLRWALRKKNRPWPFISVGIYNILLLLLFLFGAFTQKSSEGFGFLPLIFFTFPWSLILFESLLSSWLDQHIIGGIYGTLFENLLVFIFLAGPINSFILYFLLRWRERRLELDKELFKQLKG